MQKITIKSQKERQIIDITKIINDLLVKNNFSQGILFLFSMHTTCALTTADLDPGTDEDYLNAYKAITPDLQFNHPHDPSHFPDHFLSTTVGPSLFIPVQSANLVLGQYQKIVLLEFNGPKDRRISLSFLPEMK